MPVESAAGDAGSGSAPRRPAGWAIGLVVVAVAVSGLAAGAGVSPSDLSDFVSDLLGPEPTIDRQAAGVVAFDEADARRVELWFGPTTDGDGECRFVRVLSAVDGTYDAASRCVDGQMLAWSDPDHEAVTSSQYFGFIGETPIGSAESGFAAVAVTGAVDPAITAVTARFGDDAEYSFVPDPRDGWFAVILPDEIADVNPDDGSLVNVLVELELFDSEGRVLTTVDVPAWKLATGLR